MLDSNSFAPLQTHIIAGRFPSLDLASRVEAALATPYPEFDEQVILLRVTLARTYNTLVPPLHRLPEEILLEIFMNVVFGGYVWKYPDGSGPCWIEYTLTAMQLYLQSLLQVCSMWRNLLVVRDVFWSTVGTYHLKTHDGSHEKYVHLPIRGTKEANLHLVLALPLPTNFALDTLREHASQFRTINISARANAQTSPIRDIIDIFLNNTPSFLSELSISRRAGSYTYSDFELSEDNHIRRDSSDWNRLLEITSSLSVLRITGVALSWRYMTLPNRLVELQLRRITLGNDSQFPEFINALSSAPELRDLKLISIVTSGDGAPLGVLQERQRITLPKLESLLLEDIYFSTLGLLSQWLIDSTCRLSLNTTLSHAVASTHPYLIGIERVAIERLCEALKLLVVDTLVVSKGNSICLPYLDRVLPLMPALKTLKLQSDKFGPTEWDRLKPPSLPAAGSESNEQLSPKLEQLYLPSPYFLLEDEVNFEGLKDLVASHPLQKLVLGNLVRTRYNLASSRRLEETDDICVWLRSHVPDFRLVEHEISAPEFHSDVWQLWCPN
ncbi:unnamed protein product [Rhizoctonia solani]|uniref:Uncharacterized protein n=1 Tax=Rhizoctonia solani TaxID=456999 RepID=A0A8H3CHE2_9AGAM|nr:unnamed protein product [Rhizoctonia solani]